MWQSSFSSMTAAHNATVASHPGSTFHVQHREGSPLLPSPWPRLIHSAQQCRAVSISCAEPCEGPRMPCLVCVLTFGLVPGEGGLWWLSTHMRSHLFAVKVQPEMGWNSFASSVPLLTPPTQRFLFQSGNIIVLAISETSLPKSGSTKEYFSERKGKGISRVISGAGNLFTLVWEESRG